MNSGERDELLSKIMLVQLRDTSGSLLGTPINSVGFDGEEYGTLPVDIRIQILRDCSDDKLTSFAAGLGIKNLSKKFKADVYINGIGVTLKSHNAAPPALINHTARPGFELACSLAGVDISILDQIVAEYWRLRFEGIIKEDVCNSDINCPFLPYKQYLQPLVEYFMFDGTGSGPSQHRAHYLIVFSDPLVMDTYKIMAKADAFESVWERLIFCLRATKGMPKNYNPGTYQGDKAESIACWVHYHSGKYRGALHIRVSEAK